MGAGSAAWSAAGSLAAAGTVVRPSGPADAVKTQLAHKPAGLVRADAHALPDERGMHLVDSGSWEQVEGSVGATRSAGRAKESVRPYLQCTFRHCAGLPFPLALLPPPSMTPGTASMPR